MFETHKIQEPRVNRQVQNEEKTKKGQTLVDVWPFLFYIFWYFDQKKR